MADILQGIDSFRQSSFSLKNRLARLVWNIFYGLLFRLSPSPFHAWRIFMLRLFGAKIGRGCHVYPSVKIWAPWNLHFGNFVGIGNGVTLYNIDRIEIGDYAVISQGAHLCGGTHDYNSENFQLVAKPIVIGPRAWVCAEAFIHPGVVVPEGAVVGARSVVTKSFPVAWGVYSGNPCTQIAVRSPLCKKEKS